MLDITTFLNYTSTPHKWRYTKYYTGVEPSSKDSEYVIQEELKDIEECENRPRDIESIKKYCLEWAQKHIGHTFQFRQYQLEYIVTMLDNILNQKVKINCLEAPTGSGKSWIAMVISGVAWEYYRLTSYILVSDLGLMQQYWDDVYNHHIPDVGHLKGLANYICDINHFVFPSSECRMHKISYEILLRPGKAKSKGFGCALECECLQDRKRAMTAPITIMTYALYLTFINDVLPKYEDNGKIAPFDKRDIVICDEVHKLPSIVQSYCSPEFNWTADRSNFSKMIQWSDEYGLFDEDEDERCTLDEIRKSQYDIVQAPTKKEAFESLKKYVTLQNILYSKIGKIRGIVNKKKESGVELEKEDKKMLSICNWFENRQSHFEKYPKIVDKIGYEKMVVNSIYDTKTKELDKNKFTINCVYEEYLVKEYFNDQCNFEIMMSATMGDAALFRREIGVECYPVEEINSKFRFYRIPSTFDFSNSPIYVLPTYRMSFALKDQNMPYINQLIESIVARHAGQKGLIHTGSYDFSRRILAGVNDATKRRLLCYTSAKEKEEYIDTYFFQKDKVLTGPTLVEGINLPDDECRFMIIMKVPYPNLGDKLVSAKKDEIPNWYNGETVKSVIQSLGRGIRHKNDWCITYIIDGSFCTIYNATKNNLSDDLKNRIQFVSL